MTTQFNVDAAEFEKLDTLGDKALDQVKALEKESFQAMGLDVCGHVRKVMPVLKTVQSIVCKLKFVPGLKQACKALETVIAALESICPVPSEGT